MEVRSPSDTYHILYKHDTKQGVYCYTNLNAATLGSFLVVKCVIPF